ncbi:hypothetical protein O9G_000733 [Rozella allomycis CSF55]|uniref:Protein EFR3 n=1 Tax=Rozella allomycis (strain CSF55) TaxID=988480 RepID=A0A075AYH7_ROZAC|nr:hypothetical protein O9G_000733 [Rozella allomycis CSF55]|eukprot:EPZ35337.1 hypothetical protein O9G_000733 [Rozella allomycis CSF55]
MFPFLAPKHQRRVNDVYPTHPGEEGAVTSKLSRLTYYINARPVKLTKVVKYLETKVQHDLDKERSGYNKVSLEIIEALLHSCGSLSKAFAAPSLRIIKTLIENGDESLFNRTTSTFIMLLDHINAQMFVTDADFINAFNNLVVDFTRMSVVEKPEPSIQSQIRFTALSAIKSILQIENASNAEYMKHVECAIPSILFHMKPSQPKRSRSISSHSEHKRTSIYNEVVTEEGIDKLALQCLEIIIKKNQSINHVLNTIFQYFEKSQWTPAAFPLNVMKIVIQNCKSVYSILIYLFKVMSNPQYSLSVQCSILDFLKITLHSSNSSLDFSLFEISKKLLKLAKKSLISNLPTNPVDLFLESVISVFQREEYSQQKIDLLILLLNQIPYSPSNKTPIPDDQSTSSNAIVLNQEQRLKFRIFCSKALKIISTFEIHSASLNQLALLLDSYSPIILDFYNVNIEIKENTLISLKNVLSFNLFSSYPLFKTLFFTKTRHIFFCFLLNFNNDLNLFQLIKDCFLILLDSDNSLEHDGRLLSLLNNLLKCNDDYKVTLIEILSLMVLLEVAQKYDSQSLKDLITKEIETRKHDKKWIDFFPPISKTERPSLDLLTMTKTHLPQIDKYLFEYDGEAEIQQCLASNPLPMSTRPSSSSRSINLSFTSRKKQSSSTVMSDSASCISVKDLKDAMTMGKRNEFTQSAMQESHFKYHKVITKNPSFYAASMSNLGLKKDKDQIFHAFLDANDLDDKQLIDEIERLRIEHQSN